MARPKTPTAILEARGAFKTHPERRADREGEPEITEPLGDRPQDLPIAVAVVWDELVDNAHKGVLCKADRPIVEIAARLFAEFRARGADMEAAKIGRLQAALSELGMTPASRSKVKAPSKAPAANPVAGLLKKRA